MADFNKGTSYLAEAKYRAGRTDDYNPERDTPLRMAATYALIDIADSLRQIAQRLDDQINVNTREQD